MERHKKWERLLKKAIQIGIKPDEFWKMNLKEVKWHAEAYEWRKDEWAELMAHFTASQINVHLKKGKSITGKHLYKRLEDMKDDISLEERQRRFERAVEIMGADAIPVNVER